jgi:hypothetical protein
MRLLFALLVLLVGSSEARADNPCTQDTHGVIGNGMFTGVTLNEMSELNLGVYTAGVADAWSAAMLFGASEECYRKVRSCIVGRTGVQFGAMVKKYLRDNPAEWHLQGAVIVYRAVLADCLYK